MAHVSINLIDGEGGRKTIPIYFPNATTAANAQTFVTGFVPLLAAVSSAGIIGAEFCVGLTVPATQPDPVPGSRVDSGGIISYLNTNQRAWGLYIPAMLTSLMDQGVIDLTATAVENFNNAITAGISGVIPTDPNFLDLDWVAGGKQATRKTKR